MTYIFFGYWWCYHLASSHRSHLSTLTVDILDPASQLLAQLPGTIPPTPLTYRNGEALLLVGCHTFWKMFRFQHSRHIDLLQGPPWLQVIYIYIHILYGRMIEVYAGPCGCEVQSCDVQFDHGVWTTATSRDSDSVHFLILYSSFYTHASQLSMIHFLNINTQYKCSPNTICQEMQHPQHSPPVVSQRSSSLHLLQEALEHRLLQEVSPAGNQEMGSAV